MNNKWGEFFFQLRVQIQKLHAHVYTYCNKILQVKGGILSQCSGISAHHLFPSQGPQAQRSDFAETHLSRYFWTTMIGGYFVQKEPVKAFFLTPQMSAEGWQLITSWSFRWHIEFRWWEKYLGTSHCCASASAVHMAETTLSYQILLECKGQHLCAEILLFGCDSVCWDDSRISIFTKVPF